MLLYVKPIEERYWAKVNKTPGCWYWLAATSANGYGYFSVNGKLQQAHRFSWELHNGLIPRGEGYHGACVLHSCDNRACVNPDHLVLGTQKNNMRDCVNKGRQTKLPGQNHGMSKLTEAQVLHIRSRTLSGENQAKLVKEFKVSKASISKIINRKYWKHI